jgi:hypothetical protein
MRSWFSNLSLATLTNFFTPEHGDSIPTPEPKPELHPPHFDEDGIFTIDGSVYRGGESLPDVHGQLHLFNETIHFIPDSLKFNPIAVGLLFHLDHRMMPHPSAMESGMDLMAPETPYLLAIVWLEDSDELSSAQTVYFSGRKSDLECLSVLATEAAVEAQARHNYKPPALSDLPIIPVQREIKTDVAAPEVLPVAVRKRVSVPLQDIKIIGGPSKIIEPPHIIEMRKRLPRRYRNGDWRLLFQLSTDGCSCQTLYDRAEGRWPLVVAVQTDSNDRIGAFLSSKL